MRSFVWILTLLATVALAGCSGLPADSLARRYAEEAGKQGLVAVYPPREGFQVGDVFLVSSVPKDQIGAAAVWLGTLDEFRSEAARYLGTRDVYANTTITGTGASASVLSPVAQEDLLNRGEITTRKDTRNMSLLLANYGTVTGNAGFTGSAAFASPLAAFGIGTSQETTVSLDFTDVRYYEVPKVWAAKYERLAFERFGGEDLDVAAREMPQQVKLKEMAFGHRSGERCLSVAVVTKVNLTREIRYTYRDRQIIAAGIRNASEKGQLSAAPQPPSIDISILRADANNGTANDDTDAETAAIAEALKQSVGSVSGEGSSFSFVSWDATGLQFKQIFQRPVAISWEGFTYKIHGEPINGQPVCK